MKKQLNRATRFLIVSLALVLVLTVCIFSFLAFFMSFVSRFLSEDVSMLSGGFFGVILFGIAVVCSGIYFGLSIWLYKKKEF